MFLLDLQLLRTLMTKSEWVTVASFIWENFSSASLQSLRQRVLVRNTARPSKTEHQPSSRWSVKKEVSISIKFLQVHQNLPVFFPRTKSQNHWVDPHVSEEPSFLQSPSPSPATGRRATGDGAWAGGGWGHTRSMQRAREMSNWEVHKYECCLFYWEKYSTVILKY